VSVVPLESHTARALHRCAGDPETFLRDTWGRLATIEIGRGGGFDDLLSLDDVDRTLTTTALRTPFFRLVQAGERIPESAYTRSGRTGSREVDGMADPARVATFFEDGATIVLQGLHRWSEPVARFTRELELELGHPCQVNAYITPPGAQGLELHEDGHDVFVLQAFGHKRWEIHAAPREDARDPIEGDIGPGDTVYMPTGTPHAAAAQEVVSGHLTIGVHVTPWREVVCGELADLLQRIDEPVPAGWTGDPEGFARALGGHLESLASGLRGLDARAAADARVERFLSTRAQLARGSIAERAAPLRLNDDTVLRRRAGAVCELRPQSDRLVVLLGDRRLEMPGWLEPAMRRVADAESFALRELSSSIADSESRAVLGRRLVREGLLTTGNPG